MKNCTKAKHWLKRPKAVHQNTKFEPKYKWFRISYLKLVFLKTFFRACNTFQWTYSEFHLSRKCQSQQNLPKKITHFTIQFRSKNLTHFTNLNSFEIENNMLPKHSQKTFSVYKFSSKHVSVWCKKKHLHCTISWRPRTTFLKANICIFLYTSLRNFCFKDSRFYLLVWGVGEAE